jgi:cytochrome P450
MLVVADLLGVPEADHQRFKEFFGLSVTPGEVGAGEQGEADLNPLAGLDEWFARYVEDRRREPRQDVLTQLALATYPDGTTPQVSAVVRTATFLFAAGQETAARLLAAALKHLAEHPELQDHLRAHRDLIPGFVDEALRIESPVKADFRLARRSTSIAGVDVAAGTPVMLLNGAANRDPGRFECPAADLGDRGGKAIASRSTSPTGPPSTPRSPEHAPISGQSRSSSPAQGSSPSTRSSTSRRRHGTASSRSTSPARSPGSRRRFPTCSPAVGAGS